MDEKDIELHNMINRHDRESKPTLGCSRRSAIAGVCAVGAAFALAALGYQMKKDTDAALELGRKRIRIDHKIKQALSTDFYRVNVTETFPGTEDRRVPLVLVGLSNKDAEQGFLYVFADKHEAIYQFGAGYSQNPKEIPNMEETFTKAFGNPKDLADRVRKIIAANR